MKLLFLFFCVTISSLGEAKQTDTIHHYEFASIEKLFEQEVGRIILPIVYGNVDLDITITPVPAERAQYLANTGVNDGEIMRIWSYGEENPNVIRVPTPYYQLETMPFVLKGSQVKIASKDDLLHYRIAKVRGVKHTNNITKGMHQVYNASSTKNMFILLKKGVVDVAITNTADGKLIAAKLGMTDIVPLEKPLAVEPLYHYIHKKHQALVGKIDKELQQLTQSGELNILIKKAEQQVFNQNKIE